MVQNLGHMRLANHLVTRQDEGHLEVRHFRLHFVNDSLNHGKLVEKVNRVVLARHRGSTLVLADLKETARRVAQLHNEDILLNASINVRAKEALKERAVLSESADPGKLVLEEAPDVV